ncbi:MAG: hypothetical protein NVSMB32_19020 [Actinomycetota bacterium]
MPTRSAICRDGTPSAANKMIIARRRSRCGVVVARTRRSNSAVVSSSNTIGSALNGITSSLWSGTGRTNYTRVISAMEH